MMQQSEKLGVTFTEKFVMVLLPIVTTIIGYYLKTLVNLVEHVPILSDFKIVRLIHEFDANWLVWVLTALGLIVGLFLSMMTYDEILKLNVNKNYIEASINGKTLTIDHDDFGTAFKESKTLFIFSKIGRELLQEKTDYKAEELKEVFTRFNYKWSEQDPYKGEYLDWSLDDENVSKRANDILYKRKEALRDDDQKTAVALKEDLNEINIYVKDENGKQNIRYIESSKGR